MPIIWRYLLSHYLKVLTFCVIAFISILLTTRLDEVAHFATLGPEGFYILLFTLHQIPYIFPIALPIACLISSILLIQRLSRSQELTALRAAGMSLNSILAPILIAAAFLSLANFYVVSEMSTHSHLSTSLLKTELRSINPLLLLHNKHLMKLKGIFFNPLGPSKMGELASDVIFAMPSKHNDRINIMLAGSLRAGTGHFVANNVVLFTSLGDDNDEKYDRLVVENMGQADTTLKDFAQIMQKKVWTLNNDHLRLPLLLARLSEEKDRLAEAKTLEEPTSSQKQIQRSIHRIYSEIIRRFSAAFAVFTFTLMGAAFGLSIGRQHSSRSLLWVIGLASLYLVAFFAAKGADHLLVSTALFYCLPHVLIIAASLWTLNRTSRGIE